MPKTSARKFFKELDGWMYLFTGKRIKDVAPRAMHLLGEDLINKVTRTFDSVTYDPDDPYTILGARPDDSDLLVKAYFRDKAFKYHPDTGTNPDPQQFQRVTEAYNKITVERNAQRKP